MIRRSLPVAIAAAAVVAIAAAFGVAGEGHGAEAAGGPIILATEENPPANFTDPTTGELTGLAVEKMRLVMATAGLDHEFRLLPWQRALKLAESDERTCLFLTNLTEERRSQFQWVSPLMEGGWALFSRPDWQGTVETPADLARYSIVVQAGSAIEAHLKALGEPFGGFRLDSRPGFGNFARLQQGAVDLYASGLYSGPYQARREGVALRLVYRLTRSVGALACNPRMDPALVARMQAALDAITADGRAREIEAKYHPAQGWAKAMSRE